MSVKEVNQAISSAMASLEQSRDYDPVEDRLMKALDMGPAEQKLKDLNDMLPPTQICITPPGDVTPHGTAAANARAQLGDALTGSSHTYAVETAMAGLDTMDTRATENAGIFEAMTGKAGLIWTALGELATQIKEYRELQQMYHGNVSQILAGRETTLTALQQLRLPE